MSHPRGRMAVASFLYPRVAALLCRTPVCAPWRGVRPAHTRVAAALPATGTQSPAVVASAVEQLAAAVLSTPAAGGCPPLPTVGDVIRCCAAAVAPSSRRGAPDAAHDNKLVSGAMLTALRAMDSAAAARWLRLSPREVQQALSVALRAGGDVPGAGWLLTRCHALQESHVRYLLFAAVQCSGRQDRVPPPAAHAVTHLVASHPRAAVADAAANAYLRFVADHAKALVHRAQRHAAAVPAVARFVVSALKASPVVPLPVAGQVAAEVCGLDADLFPALTPQVEAAWRVHHPVALEAFVHHAVRCHHLDIALRYVRALRCHDWTPSPRCWHRVLNLAASMGDADTTVGVLNGMAAAGVLPDEAAVGRVVEGYATANQLPDADLVVSLSVKAGIHPPVSAYAALARAWARRLDATRGGARGGRGGNREAHAHAAARLRGLWHRLLQHAEAHTVPPSLYEWMAAVWARGGHVAQCEAVVRDMAQARCVTATAYNHAINAGLRSAANARRPGRYTGVAHAVQALVDDMRAHGLQPDAVTYNLVVKSLCLVKQYSAAVAVLQDMADAGHPLGVALRTILAYTDDAAAVAAVAKWQAAE